MLYNSSEYFIALDNNNLLFTSPKEVAQAREHKLNDIFLTYDYNNRDTYKGFTLDHKDFEYIVNLIPETIDYFIDLGVPVEPIIQALVRGMSMSYTTALKQLAAIGRTECPLIKIIIEGYNPDSQPYPIIRSWLRAVTMGNLRMKGDLYVG